MSTMDERVKELGKLTRKKAALQARCANLSREVADLDKQISVIAAQMVAAAAPQDAQQEQGQQPKVAAR